MRLKTHRYRGMTILPSTQGRLRWYVQTYHQTGLQTGLECDEGECIHFGTLSDARSYIDVQRREEARWYDKQLAERLLAERGGER